MSFITKEQMLFNRAGLFFKDNAYKHPVFKEYIESSKTGDLSQVNDLYEYAEELAELVKEIMSDYKFDFDTSSDRYAQVILTSHDRKRVISKAKNDYFTFVSAQKAVARFYYILDMLEKNGGKFQENDIIYEVVDSNTIQYFFANNANSKRYPLRLSNELVVLALNYFCGKIERLRTDRTSINSFKTKSIYVFSVWVISRFTGIQMGKSDMKKGIDDGKNCYDIISKVNATTYKSIINNWKTYKDIANNALLNFYNPKDFD